MTLKSDYIDAKMAKGASLKQAERWWSQTATATATESASVDDDYVIVEDEPSFSSEEMNEMRAIPQFRQVGKANLTSGPLQQLYKTVDGRPTMHGSKLIPLGSGILALIAIILAIKFVMPEMTIVAQMLSFVMIGYWETHPRGTQRTLSRDIDFYLLSARDMGFDAVLVDATNNWFKFSMPYPGGIDLFKQTIEVEAIDFMMVREARISSIGVIDALAAWVSMLDKEFPATFEGNLDADVSTEILPAKAQFDGPIYFGKKKSYDTGTVVESLQYDGDAEVFVRYFPPTKTLDLVRPLIIQFQNRTVTYLVTAHTSALSDLPEISMDGTCLRVWFTVRNLTLAEIGPRGQQIRWQQLNS